MMGKTILALQTTNILGQKKENLAIISSMLENFFAENKGAKVDFLFLGEVFSTGWCTKRFEEFSEYENGETVFFLKELAVKYNMNIFGGSYIRRAEKGLKNSCPLIDRKGNLLGHYDKIHLFSPDNEDKYVSKGENPVIVDLEGFRIGLSVCYDIRFPELFRSYMTLKNPPHLIVNMSEWPQVRRGDYLTLSRARAIENEVYFLCLSLCGKNICGTSTLFSPKGDIVSQLKNKKGWIFEKIDTEKIERERSKFSHIENIQKEKFCPKEMKV